MIILATQAVIAPVIFSLFAQTLYQKIVFFRSRITLCFIILWLVSYTWIIQLPNFPPKQALDWLGIFTLLTILPFFNSALFKGWGKYYLLLVGLIFFWVSTWPVISYEASFASHKLIWAEIALLYIWFCSVLVRGYRVNTKKHSYLNLAFSLACLAIITIMSGSLLLGLLVLAYSAILSIPSAVEIFSLNKFKLSDKQSLLHWPIAMYLALMCRVYAEVSFVALVLLLLALSFNFLFKKNYLLLIYGIPSVLNISAVLIIIWQEYISNSANMSYY